MTTRIEEFSDTVTSAVTPVTTSITGATGAPGKAFQVDEFTDFSNAKITEIEAYGTPTGNHGLVTVDNPYVVVVQIDNRSAAERTAGPTPINTDMSRHVVEWNGQNIGSGDFGGTASGAGSVAVTIINSNGTISVTGISIADGDTASETVTKIAAGLNASSPFSTPYTAAASNETLTITADDPATSFNTTGAITFTFTTTTGITVPTINITGGTWFDYGLFTGLDGSVWHTGTGVPADTLGVENDLYLDVDTGSDRGDVYQKGASTWGSAVVNIAQTSAQAINTDGEGFTGDGTTGSVLSLELDGTTLTKTASGLRWNSTLESKLGQYPTPLAADDGEVLQVNSAGNVITGALPTVTTTTNGLMSSGDKTKLDKYPNTVVGDSGDFLSVNASGNVEATTISNATDSVAGLMSSTDKSKLDQYTTPVIADNGKLNQVNASGNMALITPTKSTVGLGYVPAEFSGTTAYAIDDLVFYEGVFFKSLTIHTSAITPDMDETNWVSLGGGGGGHVIFDGTSGTRVELAQEDNLSFFGAVTVADTSASTSTDITVGAEIIDDTSSSDTSLGRRNKLVFRGSADLVNDGTNTDETIIDIKGGQIIDATGSSDVTITPRAATRLSGNFGITDDSGNDRVDVFVPPQVPNGVNLFEKGDMELAKTADYTASTGTFAIGATNVLRGTQSANWTGVSAASTLTSPEISIPTGYRDKIVEFSLIYRSTNEVTVTLVDTTPTTNVDLQTFTLPVFTGTGARKIRFFQKLPTTSTGIEFRFNTSSLTTLTFDDVVITTDFQSTGQLTNVKRFISTHEPSATNAPGVGSTATRIMDWNVDVANIVEGDGADLLTYARTAANGSSWTVNEDCRLTGFFSSSHATDSNNSGWSKNAGNSTTDIQDLAPALLISIQDIAFSNSPYSSFLSYEAKAGDVIRCHGNGTDFNSFSEWRLELQAEKIETQDVTVYNAQAEAANTFGARFTAAGGLTSQSASFVSGSSLTGTIFRVDFVPGFFSETPSVVGTAEDNGRIVSIQPSSLTTTGFNYQIHVAGAAADPQPTSFLVERQGGDVRSQTANFVIPTLDIAENVVTATIDGSTTEPAGGRILSQSANWIQSVVEDPGDGQFIVTLVPGFFTQVPFVTGDALDSSTALGITSTSTSTIVCNVNAGTGNVNFSLIATKLGADSIAPKSVDVPTEVVRTSSGIENTFTARVQGNLTIPLILSQGGNLLKDPVAGNHPKTGEYVFNFSDGLFTQVPVINITGRSVSTSDTSENVATIKLLSNTQMTVFFTDTNDAAIDPQEIYINATKQGSDYKAPEEVTIQVPLIRPNEPFLFQRKALGTAVTANNTDVTDLTFNNLEIGKVYRLGGLIAGSTGGNTGDAIIRFRDAASGGGNELGSSGSANSSSAAAGTFRLGVNVLFVASTTVMVPRTALSGGTNPNFTVESFLTLEELPYYEQTSKWS